MKSESSFIPKDKKKQWACGVEPAVENKPTLFEKQAAELGLSPEQYAASEELKAYILQEVIDMYEGVPQGQGRFCDLFYVPEWLLDAWDIKPVVMFGPSDDQEFIVLGELDARDEYGELVQPVVIKNPEKHLSDMVGTDFQFNESHEVK